MLHLLPDDFHGMERLAEIRASCGDPESVAINTTVSGLKRLCRFGIIQEREELKVVQKMIRQLSIKTPDTNFIVVNMSGGNQQ